MCVFGGKRGLFLALNISGSYYWLLLSISELRGVGMGVVKRGVTLPTLSEKYPCGLNTVKLRMTRFRCVSAYSNAYEGDYRLQNEPQRIDWVWVSAGMNRVPSTNKNRIWLLKGALWPEWGVTLGRYKEIAY